MRTDRQRLAGITSLLRRVFGHQTALRLAELTALSAFAVAQPVFEVVSNAVEFLVFRQVGSSELMIFTLVLVVVPPMLLYGVEELVGWRRPAVKRQLHLFFLAALSAVAVAQLLNVGAGLGTSSFLLGVVAGAAFAVVYVRSAAARSWARLASLAPLVFAVVFLFTPPVSALRGASLSPAPVRTERDVAPVVLLVFDELPLVSLLDGEGKIDESLYPNLAALAGESTFFRDATGVAARTTHALPAMLTGRFPSKSLAPVTSQYPLTLFSLFSGSHEVHASESVTGLCPMENCRDNEWGKSTRTALFRDSFRIWLHTLASGSEKDPVGRWLREDTVRAAQRSVPADDARFLLERLDENQPVRFQEFLGAIDGKGTPFHFLHLLLPHSPWRYLPDGMQYEPRSIGLVSHDERTAEPWPALVDRQRHLLQTAYVDQLVGQVIAQLKQVGLYDRSALLVTADHGISFIPGLPRGTRELRSENEHDVAWVPFLLKAPGQRSGVVSDDNVMGVDVAPTLAELAGVRLPGEVDGIALGSTRRSTARKTWFNEPGVQMELDSERSFARVLSEAQGMADLREGIDGLFRPGSFGHVVDTPVAEHVVVEDRDAVVRVSNVDAYADVEPANGTVPALISGSVVSSSRALRGAWVAIALNGTVAAVSELFREADTDGNFAAMTPGSFFQPGPNEVEVFLLDDQSGDVVLERLAGPS